MNNISILLLFIFSIFVSPIFAQQKVSEYSASTQFGFIENKGQIMDQNYEPNPDVKYLFPGKGVKVHLKQQSFSYEVFKHEEKQRRFSEATGWVDELGRRLEEGDFAEQSKEYDIHTHRIDIELVGSNSNAKLIAIDAAPDYINYYNSITPEEGATHVRHYDKVLYKDIYPNIDLEFSVAATDDLKKGEFVKYNFIVHPGGDYKDIKLRYSGTDGIAGNDCDNIKGTETLTLTTAHVNLQESIPYSYQLFEGNEQEIKVNYTQLDNNLFGFKPNSKVENNSTLIIDPVVMWGTFYGGSDSDQPGVGNGIAVDKDNNYIYIIGRTASSDNIATVGTHQYVLRGNEDSFIARFTEAGNRVWGTYWGGMGIDRGDAITTDGDGKIIMTGYTSSQDGVATTGAHKIYKSGPNSLWDAFVVKFDSLGKRQWGTYYGSSYYDQGMGIETDIDNNIFIIGRTGSTSGIATNNAHQTTHANRNSNDAFIVKFNSSGVRQWGTYFGGTANDDGLGIDISYNGDIYVVGSTESSNMATPGAFQTSCNTNNYCGWIAKFNNFGVLQWSTYFNGRVNDVKADQIGNLYITGTTQSSSGVSTPGAHQETTGGYYEAFLSKFNDSGMQLWGTYYGGSSTDVGHHITIHGNNDIYLTGHTKSETNIGTVGTHQPYYFGSGSPCAFLVKFNSQGTRQWGTYYQELEFNQPWIVSCASDSKGNIYTTARSVNYSDVVTPGAYQPTHGGAIELVLAKFWKGITSLKANYLIKGNIFGDTNSNCSIDSSDIIRRNIVVKAEPGSYYGISDNSGDYTIYLPDTGTYTVSVATQDSLWQTSCSTSYNVQLTNTPDSITGVNFAMTANFYCPRLEVDISAPLMRRCFDNIFTIYYSNTGSLPVSGTYVEVDFGEHLQPQSSSLPWSSVSGNVYTFPIGNLDNNGQGTFRVTALLSCNAQLNSTQCVSARILPDTPCFNPDSAYFRRQLHIKGECYTGDSVAYTIYNNHDSVTHNGYFKLYLNSTFLDSLPFTIANNDSSILKFPANGNTLRLETVFDYGAYTVPGPQSTVEACGANPVWGHVNTLPQNDEALNFETFCLTVIGAYDPNDKQVFPEGLTSNRYIKDNTELEYLIRFQNTGTDTAFTVVIRDTLSSYLDVPSIQLGSSSHDYTFNIYGQGIAEWTFNNILLPDSHVNEPASRGFVKYKIRQKPNNAMGTLIKNRAGIYFDFNLPIITNEVFNIVNDTTLICNKPEVEFTFSLDNTELSLSNNTPIGQGFTWDMGDSNFYSIASPIHLYDSIGSYNVCLTARNICGANTKCDTVTISNSLFTQPLTNAEFCVGGTITVPYIAKGMYQSGNNFIAQLSNNTGNFNNPVDIGSLNDIVSGSITAVIPTTTLSGSGYRIRVISTNPAIIAEDNGINLKINKMPSAPSITSNDAIAFCIGDSVTLSSSKANNNLWNNGDTTQAISVSVSGNYSVKFTDINGCESPFSPAVGVTVHSLPQVNFTFTSNSVICENTGVVTLSGGTPYGGFYSGKGIRNKNFHPSEAGQGTHEISYTYIDSNNCTNTDTTTVNIETCSGINETNAFKSINLYPNPNAGTFSIELQFSQTASDIHIEVFNTLGQSVYSSRETTASISGANHITKQISLDQASGIFLLKVTVDGEILVKSVVVR